MTRFFQKSQSIEERQMSVTSGIVHAGWPIFAQHVPCTYVRLKNTGKYAFAVKARRPWYSGKWLLFWKSETPI